MYNIFSKKIKKIVLRPKITRKVYPQKSQESKEEQSRNISLRRSHDIQHNGKEHNDIQFMTFDIMA